MARKIKTLDEVQAMLKKAEGFARDVLRDPDKADQFASMGPDEYAEKRGIEIRNLARNKAIERTNVMTKADVESLLDDVDALLEDALDPRLSREEVIDKVMEASDLISREEAGEGEEPEEDEADED